MQLSRGGFPSPAVLYLILLGLVVGCSTESSSSPREEWYAHMVHGSEALSSANWDVAEQEFRSALNVASNADEHYQALDRLGALYQAIGRLADAEAAHRRALDFAQDAHGETSHQVGVEVHNIANVLLKNGATDQAEKLFGEALRIFENSRTRKPAYIADTTNSLGVIHYAREELDVAENMFRKSLGLYDEIRGGDSIAAMGPLGNLGNVLRRKGEFDEAETVFRRILAIQDREYGASHPEVADTLNYLASSLHAAHKLDESETCRRRALAIDERFYGSDHLKVAADLENLAKLLVERRELVRAAECYARALEIHAKKQPFSSEDSGIFDLTYSYIECLRLQGKSLPETVAILSRLPIEESAIQELTEDAYEHRD